ncbi:type 1 glutamine amidotransferase family protein [Desulfobacterales bacterium HSG17]|nr:type 1 glutamine amidotransferase family protein [Desulfobacterales bacterium HSG17]
MEPNTNTDNVYIFLFNGFSDWEIAYLAPELRKSEKIVLKYFTIDDLEIISDGGLKITPDLSIKELNPADISVLILPGGSAWEENSIKGIDNLVETLNSEKKTVAAICGATTYLGQKGYLDEVKHTSNALEYLQYIASNYKGEKKYQSDLAVVDENIITANGIAPIEFAREIFKNVNLKSEKEIEKWFQLFKNGIWSE